MGSILEKISALSFTSLGFGDVVLIIVFALFFLFTLWLIFFWALEIGRPIKLNRFSENPILGPIPEHWWESSAVFNPAAFVFDGKVHILYRALGQDGISRIGYASSRDGIHFERLPYPVYAPDRNFGIPNPNRVWGPLSYSTYHYASGGGWGGVEDPRIVLFDGKAYMSFVAFDGWGFIRMALTSLPLPKFARKEWQWKSAAFLSPPNEIHKNWVIFPEKINGKYAILHSISPKVSIEYVKSLDMFGNGDAYIHSIYDSRGRMDRWDNWVRGAGPPPIATPHGWLLLYHAMDRNDPNKYKLGAMILDKHDPTKVLYRSNRPILEPDMPYENNWKPGVVYACGAVVIGARLIVYYGGGDKYVAAAQANLEEFLHKLTSNQHASIEPVRV
ncbi:MAG TPA: hypothetical protein VD928_02630 [Candidatus Paceibacterota bacterium]|nr:hypothetical protein [Candidatus Paceibacterota bacterium]